MLTKRKRYLVAKLPCFCGLRKTHDQWFLCNCPRFEHRTIYPPDWDAAKKALTSSFSGKLKKWGDIYSLDAIKTFVEKYQPNFKCSPLVILYRKSNALTPLELAVYLKEYEIARELVALGHPLSIFHGMRRSKTITKRVRGIKVSSQHPRIRKGDDGRVMTRVPFFRCSHDCIFLPFHVEIKFDFSSQSFSPLPL